MTKQKILETVENLPENFELEDLFERLLLVKRIEEGIRQSDNRPLSCVSLQLKIKYQS